MEIENIRVLILAAGRGVRLRPLTETTPKPLLVVEPNGLSIIENQIIKLTECGLKHFYIGVGYQSEKIKNKLSESVQKHNLNINLRYIENKNFMYNTLHSYFYCINTFNSADTILLNGDVVFDIAITQNLINSLDQKDKQVLVIQKKSTVNREEVKVLINDKNQIVEFHKEIPVKKAYGEFTGISYLNHDYVHATKEIIPTFNSEFINSKYYEDGFNLINKQIRVFPTYIETEKNRFIEIDTNEDLAEAINIFE